MIADRASHVALALAPGIGPARFATLIEAFGSADGALSAPFEFLCRLPGFSRAGATTVRTVKREEGEKALAAAEAMGAGCLLFGEDAYPAALATIPDPPMVLFVSGDPGLLAQPAVAIVGSRDHTGYGAEVARTIAAAAAGAGVVVVSGMARGLDAVAHTAALDRGGSTIGVLGNGLGVIYPAANRALYERVAREGLLLSEFPPGERPRHGSFPRRNRLISGLATATLVVEAAPGSGALITAEAALEQGREVLAVPGPITSATSTGTNRLIRDGATPLLEAEDLLSLYPTTARRPAAPAPPAETEPLPLLPPAEAALFAQLDERARHIDDLVRSARRPVAEVLGILCSLEVAGLVVQEPGGRFRRRVSGK